jgi:ubiquitin-conjugating enzyme E2 variant
MNHKTQPLFLGNTAGNVIFSWAGVFGNLVVVSWGSWWLAACHAQSGVAWYHLIGTFFLGLFLLDWFSGFVHWSYDTWFDERMPGFQRSVSIAREHHVLPHNIVGYTLRDHVSYSSWPALVFVGPVGLALSLWAPFTLASYLGVLLCTLVGFGMFFGSHCHLLAHQSTATPLIRLLRRTCLLVTPAYHRAHHSGNHDVRYAVVNGWSNFVCDRVGFWRGLELLIQTATAAKPRRSDHEWMERFKRRLAAHR